MEPGRGASTDMTLILRKSRLRFAAASATVALLVGCAVGPDFHRPAAPDVKGNGYTADPLATTASADVVGGDAQRFVRDLDIPGQWWELFHSRSLNDLIEQALKANPNLRAAQAALIVAQENVYAQEGAFYPQAAAGVSMARQRTSAVISPTPSSGAQVFNLATAQVSVSYMPDVWGLNRRTVESFAAQAESQRFQLEATYLTLTSNVVAAAVQEALLRAQIKATEDIIKIETDLLNLLLRQFSLGQVAGLDVAAQQSALAAAEQTLPPLQKQLAQQRDLMAALAGGLPSEELAQKFDLASLQLPQDLPLSLPSKMVEQRPDIRQAEANLQSASAQIGVAIANRLPNITLSYDVGSTALQMSSLFTSGSGMWTKAISLTQPLFEGGTLLHRERAARAAYNETAEIYRSAVIAAFQNVADTLHALKSDADALRAADASERAARRSLDLTRRQLELGFVNYLSLLTAQQTYLTALINLAQAQANRYADTAALFQALGGGWWNRADVAAEG